MEREYDLIPCPGPSCKHGYVGWRQCDYCEGLGKIFIPRPKPKRRHLWLYVVAFIVAVVAAVAIVGKP